MIVVELFTAFWSLFIVVSLISSGEDRHHLACVTEARLQRADHSVNDLTSPEAITSVAGVKLRAQLGVRNGQTLHLN